MQFGHVGKQEYDDKMDESLGNGAMDPWASLNLRNISSTHRTYMPAHTVSPSFASPSFAQF